jgi:hypothetical protein
MLPANLLSAVLGKAALSDKPLISGATDKSGPQSALKLEIGQQVQGTVQSQVSPSNFQVKIANQVVQMQLPAFIRSGDLITLQVASLHPRLTFSLAASTNPVSTSEQLSSTSRLLSSMSQQPIEQNYVRPTQQAPLWVASQTAPDTRILADKLHHALSHSGLFYESHQAQWIAGMRSTPQLMQEPQNQLPARPDTALQPADNATPVNAANKSGAPASVIPEHLLNLVQQQLHTLENRQVLWQGQAWQGQEMRWEVREESPRHTPKDDPEGQWVTELNLNLPRLGNVSFKLSFNGNAVNLAMVVAEEKTRDTLHNESLHLLAALEERGIPVLQTVIKLSTAAPT